MLLALNNVSFSFGARPMLTEANWQIGEGERIGLIGPNGAGKSTLLRLIMGEYTIDSGNIQRANDTSIGFFNQDLLSFSSSDSILSVGMTAFEKAVAIEKTMESIMKDLETNGDDEELLLQYSEALHDFEMAGGYEMEHRTAEVLEGLGFSTADLQRPYNEFSGGWRMRVLLAKLMLQQPDILMLDEPTNHLDLPSIEWLERYLQSYPGTVIIVSHDRYFLDRMVTRIVELFQQDLISYSGNYSFYEVEKATRMEFLEREFENQQKYIEQQERFIERFKAKASKAKQAQSLMKKLDKIERIELPGGNAPRMNISFDVEKQPGKIICDLKHASKNYGPVQILNNTNAEIDRGDKIALVGANGKGKSTLMRIVAGTEPFEGERSGWHNVKASFYAQHQLESLNLEHTLLEEMKHCGSGKTELELRQLLGCFLFSGDDVFKKIKVLSGGEKARVALAKVIAGKANFLLLDEPTNHLDIQSVELLIEALNKYEGTYVLISHDRYFVSRTANKYWEIEDGKVNAFAGTYEEWATWKEERAERRKQDATPAPAPRKQEVKKEQKPVVDTKEQNDRKKELQKHQKELQKVEQQVNEVETEKIRLEQAMADPKIYADNQQFKAVEQQYQACVASLGVIQQRYDTLFEKIMELEE
ncbi:ABC-F family ATP-binding cassette domain-containing protein [Taibaiella koreensis]|uniref:ABC-F family ATP-binding cassette domain-containing protein n=1 Tax=Taibaiella koreensis TaxID=1268548 RepID=UPI000E59C184|nr:ABC-F family ATP-binding cassette domain-containing protein [Taibaiella koreensis]